MDQVTHTLTTDANSNEDYTLAQAPCLDCGAFLTVKPTRIDSWGWAEWGGDPVWVCPRCGLEQDVEEGERL